MVGWNKSQIEMMLYRGTVELFRRLSTINNPEKQRKESCRHDLRVYESPDSAVV